MPFLAVWWLAQYHLPTIRPFELKGLQIGYPKFLAGTLLFTWVALLVIAALAKAGVI
jgi:hypothetical protein